jgi:hypothetical protein
MLTVTSINMSKSVEYRAKAAQCESEADRCRDNWAKEVWRETARTWLRLGVQYDRTIERKSPPKTEVEPAAVSAGFKNPNRKTISS